MNIIYKIAIFTPLIIIILSFLVLFFKGDKMKTTKGLALFIPSLLSVAILMIVLCELCMGKFSDGALTSATLSIIGIAISVWIGLNIYNVVEKKEVDEVKTLYNDLKETIETQKKEQEYFEVLAKWQTMYHAKMVSLRDFKDEEDTIFIAKYLNKYEDCIIRFKHMQLVNEEKATQWLPSQFELLVQHLQWYLYLNSQQDIEFEEDIDRLITEIDNIIIKELNYYLELDGYNMLKPHWQEFLTEQLEYIEFVFKEYNEYIDSNKLAKKFYEKTKINIEYLTR